MAQIHERDLEMAQSAGIMILEELDPPAKQTAERCLAYMVSAPIVVAGYGGWSRVARPRRRAITEWVGRDSLSMEINFLFDGRDEEAGTYVEANIRSLERMAGIGIPGTDPQPPLIRVESVPANLMPYGYGRAPGTRWFVDTLSWDRESIVVGPTGNRQRAGGTLVVTQFVEDQRLDPIKKRKNRDSDKPKRKTYIVKRGDTLQKIAARKDIYHDAKKWKRIARANHIRDPKLGPRFVGKTLKIPR